MKKILILVLIFIFIPFAFSAETNSGDVDFNIVLQRSGKTEYYFTEYDSDTRLERVIFPLITSNTTSVTASLGFSWSMYNSGNYAIDLIFRSGSTNADSDFMLRKQGNSSIGYNYSVYVDKYNENNEIDPSEDASLDPATTSRTCRIFSGFVSQSSGNTGRVGLRLVLTTPTSSDGTVGFGEGQYVGEIAVNVVTV